MAAVYLVRHGQASFGTSDYDRLSETGFDQARLLGRALRARLPRVDGVYAGTMRRHRETAETCLSELGLTNEIVALSGFDEFDHEEIIVRHRPEYADLERRMADMDRTGNPRRAFQAMFEDAVTDWIVTGDGGEYTETWGEFRGRSVAALKEIIRAQGRSRTALVFTSGGPITAIVQDLLGIPDATAFRINHTLTNCGVTKVIYSERARYLSSVNEHGHFEGEHAGLITYR